MSNEPQPESSIILYRTEDGRTRIQCRFEDETIWLTQAQIAELFQTTPQNVTLHLKAIFAEGELSGAATCKDYLQVRSEGGREVSRNLRHYRLEAILAVGYRVRSHRGTQFRQWATARLSEYLVKGFTMDDERLKNPPGKGHTDYFDEVVPVCVVREICGPTWLCAFCLFGGNISDKVSDKVWDKAEGRTCAGPSSILDLQSSICRALDLPFSIRLPAPRAEQETKATEKERGYGLTPHPHPRRMKCHNSRTDPEDNSRTDPEDDPEEDSSGARPTGGRRRGGIGRLARGRQTQGGTARGR